jgi:hypothetical protein
MKKFLKQISILFFLFLLIYNKFVYAQCSTGDFVLPPPPSNPSSTAPYASKNGFYLPASGTIRILIVFAEINYNTTVPDPIAPNLNWPAHQLPVWASSFVDPNVPVVGQANGLLTRYFQDASSGNLNIIGDYLVCPTNGGVFSIDYSQGVTEAAVVNKVNLALNGNFVTSNSFNSVTDFDNWTCSLTNGHGPGQAKLSPSTDSPNKIDHVMLIWRNRYDYVGTGNTNAGSLGSLQLLN